MLPTWRINKKGNNFIPDVSQLVDLGVDPEPMPISTGTTRERVQLLNKIVVPPEGTNRPLSTIAPGDQD